MIPASLRLLIVLAVVAIGCTDGSDATKPAVDDTTEDVAPAPIDLKELEGESWVLQFGGGPSGDVPVIEDWPITLEFGADNFGGIASCNRYQGKYLIDGHEFIVNRLTKTDAGCESAMTESERIYLAAFRDVDGINLIDDDLALSGPSSELIFRPTE